MMCGLIPLFSHEHSGQSHFLKFLGGNCVPGAAVKIQDKTSIDPAINLDRESRALIEGLFTLKSDVFNVYLDLWPYLP